MTAGTGSEHPGARIGLLQVCAAAVLWGTGGLVVTVLHERDGFGAMTASAWRMALAAAALVGFSLLTGRSSRVRGTLRAHPLAAVLLGCGTAAYQGLYFVSVLMVGVSVATVVSLGLAPVLAASWEHLVDRTRPSRQEVLVLAAALVGLVLIGRTRGDGAAAPGAAPGPRGGGAGGGRRRGGAGGGGGARGGRGGPRRGTTLGSVWSSRCWPERRTPPPRCWGTRWPSGSIPSP